MKGGAEESGYLQGSDDSVAGHGMDVGKADNEEDMARAWMGMKEQRRVTGSMDDRARGDERRAEWKDYGGCHVMLWKASSKMLRL